MKIKKMLRKFSKKKLAKMLKTRTSQLSAARGHIEGAHRMSRAWEDKSIKLQAEVDNHRAFARRLKACKGDVTMLAQVLEGL